MWDLSSNFIFTENDIGKNRALASVQKLQELNNAVAVSTLMSKLTKEKLSDFQVLYFIQFTKIIISISFCECYQFFFYPDIFVVIYSTQAAYMYTAIHIHIHIHIHMHTHTHILFTESNHCDRLTF